MRLLLCGICWLVPAAILVCFSAGEPDTSKKLQGTWKISEAEREGKAADDVVGHRLTFAGDQFRIDAIDGKQLFQGTFRIDPTASPARITFNHAAGELKGSAWEGIYVLERDSLRICDNAPNPKRARPTTFRTEPGSGSISVVSQRAPR